MIYLSNMKLLVVGGAGFLGTNFVRHAIQKSKSWDFTVLDVLVFPESVKNLSGLDSNHFRFVQADMCNPQLLEQYVPEADVIVNFADESRSIETLGSAWAYIYSNLLGTYYLIEAATKHKKRLHHVSTDKIYGDLGLNNDGKFTEASAYRPYTPYSSSKASANHLVLSWAWTRGLKATLSIASTVYGPYQRTDKLVASQITSVISGRTPMLIGSGENVRDWTHAEDHSSAVLKIIESGKVGQAYLIGSNIQKNNKEVTEVILETMGRSLNEYRVIEDKVPHDQRRAIDPSKIMNELGWRPVYVDFNTGLAETIKWYQDNQAWWQSQNSAT